MGTNGTSTNSTDPRVQELVDSIREKLIEHKGRWDAIPPDVRQRLLDELNGRQISFRDPNDTACTQSMYRGQLMPSGEILLCPGANEAVLLHELVHAAGGQELDSEALENHLYRTQDSDPTYDDYEKFIGGDNPCRYMDGKTLLITSRFVIWNPKSGDIWFQTGSRRSPKKGKKLSEGFMAPMDIQKKLEDSPPPECANQQAQKCGAPCKDFDQYGYCDRKVLQPPCYQHRAAV